MTSKQIRQQFLDFFASKQHTIVDSSPVVPLDDPTLMFTNAGMNQFKDVFLGTGSRPYTRVADTQKCIRAGGKHNDLDDVGQDTYHHTFFEMLGNWSFGDYFKKEAIEWAWELLTGIWGIEKDRLHATYFGGLRKQPRDGGTQGRSDQGDQYRDREGAARGSDEATRGRSDGETGCTRPVDKGGINGGVAPDAVEWELEPDLEARDLWLRVTDIDPTHVHAGTMKDNFWEMGETGPCGPCSEIHIDLTPDQSGGPLVNAGDARVIELWNLVFIQFNRDAGGKLTPLPARHVDTGMGFERLCAVLQGMAGGRIDRVSNYDTDVFAPIFAAIQKRTGAPAYCGTLPQDDKDVGWAPPTTAAGESPQSAIANRQSPILRDVSYRIIADHIRCLTFALTDGAIPSNEGRGYVLRRILRRAVRYGRQYMNMHEPFLCDLVEPVVNHMSEAFPELCTGPDPKAPRDNVKYVADLIREEEASFLRTIDRALARYDEAVIHAVQTEIAASKGWRWQTSTSAAFMMGGDDDTGPPGTPWRLRFRDSQGAEHAVEVDPGNLESVRHLFAKRPMISGKLAFMLHDTYGFPIDLTELMAEEQHLTVNVGEYERLMDEARAKARQAAKLAIGDIAANVQDYGPTRFVGYDSTKHTATITAIVKGRDFGIDAATIQDGEPGIVILDETPFYAEMGGQVGDQGVLSTAHGRFLVEQTQCQGNVTLHVGRCTGGSLHSHKAFIRRDDVKQLTRAMAEVDETRRLPTARNHTSTHMLNWALRKVLGDHIQQKGSLVDPEKARFDFSHNKPLTVEELTRVEDLVNEMIQRDLPVYTQEVPLPDALKIKTLRAVFGEKYADPVRVVSCGADVQAVLADPDNREWMKHPVELCGGTHLKHTGEAERFVLILEEAVGKGVRRLVGIAGEAAKQAEETGWALLAEAEALMGEPPVAPNQNRDSHGAVPVPSPDRKRAENGSDAGPAVRTFDVAAVAEFRRKVEHATIPLRIRRELQERIAALQKEAKKQEKQAASVSSDAVMDCIATLLESAPDVAGVRIVVGQVPPAPVESLRGAIDWVRHKVGASAVLLATVDDNRVTLIAGMSKDVVARGVKAGDLIKEIAPLVGGRGGGRPDMAQGGGDDPSGLEAALNRAGAWVSAKLG